LRRGVLAHTPSPARLSPCQCPSPRRKGASYSRRRSGDVAASSASHRSRNARCLQHRVWRRTRHPKMGAALSVNFRHSALTFGFARGRRTTSFRRNSFLEVLFNATGQLRSRTVGCLHAERTDSTKRRLKWNAVIPCLDHVLIRNISLEGCSRGNLGPIRAQ